MIKKDSIDIDLGLYRELSNNNDNSEFFSKNFFNNLKINKDILKSQ